MGGERGSKWLAMMLVSVERIVLVELVEVVVVKVVVAVVAGSSGKAGRGGAVGCWRVKRCGGEGRNGMKDI